MKKILTQIKIVLPKNTFSDNSKFIQLFNNTNIIDNVINFPNNPEACSPSISAGFGDVSNPTVNFLSDREDFLEISVTNETGEVWKSPHEYKPLSLGEFRKRLNSKNIVFQYYDHLGINLPWKKDLHPRLMEAIKILKDSCLLHSFPGNDNWYFIIPGSEGEILSKTEIDYRLDRKSKFEFVNFLKCSTPILQVDFSTNVKYEVVRELFPEAIFDDNLRNLWVYISNNAGIDICFVLNEIGSGWTSFFEGCRIK